MKVFNKDKAEQKLKLKQNKNKYIKYFTIGLSCLILVIGIIMFTFAYLETKEEFTLINGTVGAVQKNVVLNANGGTLANNTIRLTLGEIISNLPIPTKDSGDFEAWYLDSGLTQKVTSSTVMHKELTNLYAKYKSYKTVSGDLNTVGSVVRIADEEFYVIGQEDETHVKLLSKWNLNVGDNAKGTATGLQDEDVRAFRYDGETTYGNVVFSSTYYWRDSTNNKAKDEYGGYTYNKYYYDGQGNIVNPYVYDSNSTLYQYVNNYVTYLNNQGVNVSGRLIKQEELVALGCNASTNYCDSSGTHGGTAPEWVYQTSYWSGSAAFWNGVWRVLSDGYFGSLSYDSGRNVGVRPVIILEK